MGRWLVRWCCLLFVFVLRRPFSTIVHFPFSIFRIPDVGICVL